MDIQRAITKAQLPDLYSTENVPTEEKLIYLHFVFGNCRWFAAEYDGKDTFFGYVILNGDLVNAEWGYFSLQELLEISIGNFTVQLDANWKTTSAKDLEIIRLSSGVF